MKKAATESAAFIRPGDFKNNINVMLAYVKEAAEKGEKVLSVPRSSIAGGDCGSLAEHPAFKEALDEAYKQFIKEAAKIKNAPKIFCSDQPKRPYLGAGDDPRYPFCGSPGNVFSYQVQGLAERLSAMKCSQVVIGLSGGLDSALTLLVAHTAFELLEYKRSGIHVYTMPGFGTTKRTKNNAQLLCDGLGIKLETIDITAACRQHFKDIAHPADLHDVVFENAQARERTQILMDKANMLGGIVLGTGDMSEIALGWSTFNGDHMSMYSTNAGVPKTAVRDVCKWWADLMEKCLMSEAMHMERPNLTQLQKSLRSVTAIQDILDTPVSPELLPAKGGKIAQKTEDKIGPYELHDFFLWHFVAELEDREEIFKAAKAAFKKQYDAATIKKWLNVFLKRFFSQSFKRNCAPDGARVFEVFFSPDAWHMPSTICGDAFL